MGYTDPLTKGFMMTPLSYAELEYGWNFSSEQCSEGMVGIHANYLRSVFTTAPLAPSPSFMMIKGITDCSFTGYEVDTCLRAYQLFLLMLFYNYFG